MALEMRLITSDGGAPLFGHRFVCDYSHIPIENVHDACFGMRTPTGEITEARHLFVVLNEHIDEFCYASGGKWLWSPLAQLPPILLHNAGVDLGEAIRLATQAASKPSASDHAGPG